MLPKGNDFYLQRLGHLGGKGVLVGTKVNIISMLFGELNVAKSKALLGVPTSRRQQVKNVTSVFVPQLSSLFYQCPRFVFDQLTIN